MRWTPGQMSSDIEDRRGSSGGFGGKGIGLVGLLVLLVLSLLTDKNYIGSYLSNAPAASQPASVPRAVSPEENRSAQLVSFVLDDVQNTWTRIFAQSGQQYSHAKLVLFRDYTPSGCGAAQSATGPFYCPADQKVYIDLGFWDDLRRFGASGDFAQAYVVAHELGHHVQNLLGIERKARMQQQEYPPLRNRLSVAMELQADCFAGIWAYSTAQRDMIDRSDVAQGLNAAAAVGDDHIQKMSRGYISPESFTHGSSEQRVEWFKRGMQTGDIRACNTFANSGS